MRSAAGSQKTCKSAYESILKSNFKFPCKVWDLQRAGLIINQQIHLSRWNRNPRWKLDERARMIDEWSGCERYKTRARCELRLTLTQQLVIAILTAACKSGLFRIKCFFQRRWTKFWVFCLFVACWPSSLPWTTNFKSRWPGSRTRMATLTELWRPTFWPKNRTLRTFCDWTRRMNSLWFLIKKIKMFSTSKPETKKLTFSCSI